MATEQHVTYDSAKLMAEHTGQAVIVLEHDLAPEKPFPQGYTSCYIHFIDALYNPDLEIDRKKISLFGYSSGASYAMLLPSQIKALGIHISELILVSPFVDLDRSHDHEAWKKYEDADSKVSPQILQLAIDNYLHEQVKARPILASPLSGDELIAQLPPSRIVSAEYDCTRGDAELLRQKLQRCDFHLLKGEKYSHGSWWDNTNEIIALAFPERALLSEARLEASENTVLTTPESTPTRTKRKIEGEIPESPTKKSTDSEHPFWHQTPRKLNFSKDLGFTS